MKNEIVADGAFRHFLGQQAVKSRSTRENYADQLAKAEPDEKKAIYKRMADEAYRREKMLNHKPSAGTLW